MSCSHSGLMRPKCFLRCGQIPVYKFRDAIERSELINIDLPSGEMKPELYFQLGKQMNKGQRIECAGLEKIDIVSRRLEIELLSKNAADPVAGFGHENVPVGLEIWSRNKS